MNFVSKNLANFSRYSKRAVSFANPTKYFCTKYFFVSENKANYSMSKYGICTLHCFTQSPPHFLMDFTVLCICYIKSLTLIIP